MTSRACPTCNANCVIAELVGTMDGGEKIVEKVCPQCKGKGTIPFPGAKK